MALLDPQPAPTPRQKRPLWNGVLLVLVILFASSPDSPVSADDRLSSEERALAQALEVRQPEMLASLRELVVQNTGSANIDGLEAMAEHLKGELSRLGFETRAEVPERVEVPGGRASRAAPVIIGRRANDEAGPRFLLVGHYDTVFEPDHAFSQFSTSQGHAGTLRGPGVADMKGGLVVMLEALRALRESGDLERASWTVLFNGDEETGSLASRDSIEREARRADYGFVFEAARTSGGMVESRRGLGQFYLSVEGVAAHAGSAHRSGHSAVLELARKVVMIEALTDYANGVTLNVGVIGGGIKRNVIPERAFAWIDLRYDRPEDGIRIRRELERISALQLDPDTRSQLWGRLHRPPKLAGPEVRALLSRHREVAAALGIELPPSHHAGGGTDGSLMGAVGLPTLDSMGVVGSHAHTDAESAAQASLTERAALAAILLRRLIQLPAPAQSSDAAGSLYPPGPGR